MNKLARNLRVLRKKARMTQVEFGEMFGVTRGQMSSYEKGVNPKVEFIFKVANYFDIDMHRLVNEEIPDPRPEEAELPQSGHLADTRTSYEEEPHYEELIRQQREMIELLKKQIADKDKLIQLLEEKLKN